MGLDIGFAVKVRAKSGVEPAVWLSFSSAWIDKLGPVPDSWHDSYDASSVMDALGADSLTEIMVMLGKAGHVEQDRFVHWRGARRAREFIQKRLSHQIGGAKERTQTSVDELCRLLLVAEKYHLGLEVSW